MVSYFRPNDFKQSVESILSNTTCPFHLTIIDNSSNKLDTELNKINDPRVTIYRNDKNVGKGAAINQRFNEIMAGNTIKYFISIDSDVIVPKGWLLELKRSYFAVQRNSKPGIIAPAIMSEQNNTWENQLKNNKLDMHNIGNLHKIKYYNGLYYNRYIAGPLLLIDIAFFKKVGLYYDKQLYGADDGMLCKAAAKHSRFIGINSNITIEHINQDSTIEYINWKKRNITMDVDQCGHWD